MVAPEKTDAPAVRFYWRPGCFFCASLERRLVDEGVTLEKLNIWDDASNAAFVRSVAGGNETVPTVVVGDEAMVNPSAAQVVEALRKQAAAAGGDGAPAG